MYLGQAINYIDSNLKDFIIQCENNSILGVKRGNFIVCKRYGDERLQGEVLNTEVFSFSVLNDKIVLTI